MIATIRKTTNHELIHRLDLKIFGKDEANDDPLERTVWFLAIMDGKVAGFAGVTPFTEAGVRHGYLERAGVLKPFRGHGLQKLLIQARDKEALRMGLGYNVTYTADWNCASANSLIKCGYKLYLPSEKYGLKGALYWRKQLKGA